MPGRCWWTGRSWPSTSKRATSWGGNLRAAYITDVRPLLARCARAGLDPHPRRYRAVATRAGSRRRSKSVEERATGA